MKIRNVNEDIYIVWGEPLWIDDTERSSRNCGGYKTIHAHIPFVLEIFNRDYPRADISNEAKLRHFVAVESAGMVERNSGRQLTEKEEEQVYQLLRGFA